MLDYETFKLKGNTRFFCISNKFISNDRLKLQKNQAYGKQHREAEVLLFENYSRSASTLSSKSKDISTK